MAGSTMTFTYEGEHRNARRIVVDWLSDDTDGDVTGTTKVISGYLLKGVTDPDAVAAPTNLYDIVLTDDEGSNILGNCFDDLLNRSNVAIESVDFEISDGKFSIAERPCVCDPITVSITNAGNVKQGRLVLNWIGG